MKHYFTDLQDFTNKVSGNDVVVLKWLTNLMIQDCLNYSLIREKRGRDVAQEYLTETLVVFRRQVKFRKTDLKLTSNKILVNGLGLQVHLDKLIILLFNIREFNENKENQKDIVYTVFTKNGVRNLAHLQESVRNTLHYLGCYEENEINDLFHESLVTFFGKFAEGQIGLIFSGSGEAAEDFIVYNTDFFQSGKLSAYLNGIAKNIYRNRLKLKQLHPEKSVNKDEIEITDHGVNQEERFDIYIFLIYRALVETRKIRSAISLLQYDCGLEDKEICRLTGMNNARFHSSRLRQGFWEWFNLNQPNLHLFLDRAAGYFAGREARITSINRKLNYARGFNHFPKMAVSLDIFREEFRSEQEFLEFHPIFTALLYLSSIGKERALSGLPDEEQLREMMAMYREGLFHLNGLQAILFLYFYGTDEPETLIVNLIDSILSETTSHDPNPVNLRSDAQESADFLLLSDKIYRINQKLFRYLKNETGFPDLILQNEND